MSEYYVYVYIDPRNFEEFYFGKGKGSRMNAHLSEDSDSGKSTRIKAIHAAGLEPIVRVIARGLSEHDAFLVEKTLLWKLGKNLTNISSGHYAENFRPHDTLHVLLSGFDFSNGIYYYNVGESPHRHWDDYRQFGYISAGQGVRWRDPMLQFHVGDLIAAYLKGHGYVGIGRIVARAQPIRNVCVDGVSLLSRPLRCERASENSESKELSEYVCLVEWIRALPREQAKWISNAGLFSSTHIRASLDGQPTTISYLNEAFEIDIRAMIR